MTNTQDLVQILSEKYGNKRESLIPILQGIVEEHKWLSKEAMLEVSKELDISAAEVYGTASFYSFLDTEERGENVIRVCKSITCDMKGKDNIIKTISDILRINIGGTSKGNRFTLLETNCLGWCADGPAMLINDEVYTELTPQKIRKIMGQYIREEKEKSL